MKKLLIAAGIIAITCSTQVLAQEVTSETSNPCPIARQETIMRDCVRPPKHFRPHFDMKKFTEELNLTDKQKIKLEKLREAELEAAKPLFEQLKQKEKEAHEIRMQLRELKQKNKKEFEAILTKKQLEKLEQIKAEHRKNFENRRHHGEFRRPPMIPCDRPAPIENN